MWRRYRKNRTAVVGLAIVTSMVTVALISPIISPYDPKKTAGDPLRPPGFPFLMGTDDLGRDVLSGAIQGARASLLVGASASLIAIIIGTLVGSLSGYHGGLLDDVLMRVTELFQVIPRFLLSLLLIAAFGPSIWNIVIAIGILSWPTTARLLRAEFLSHKERQYVQAARAIGFGQLSIIFGEILPNAISPVIVNASIETAHAILIEAGISFLGLGDPTVTSWGSMLQAAQQFLAVAWWTAAFPGLFIFVTVLGLNLVGDGINDILNPRFKER